MFCGKAGLAKDVGESPLSQSMVLRHDGPEGLLRRSFFEGHMTALLAQYNESSALEDAYEAHSGDTRQFRHLPGDFDNRPEGLLFGRAVLGITPGFEVELNRFAEICPRGLDVFALRSHIKFGAACYIGAALFRD